jgi:hypothetical protein
MRTKVTEEHLKRLLLDELRKIKGAEEAQEIFVYEVCDSRVHYNWTPQVVRLPVNAGALEYFMQEVVPSLQKRYELIDNCG